MLDLGSKMVSTLAGTGKQGQDRRLGGPAKEVGLNSPWDLWLDGNKVYVAMAGHHQIWVMDLKAKSIVPFAGSGRETLMDGELLRSCFAQPSGLTSDGKNLFVADSETSSLRSLPIAPVEGTPMVSTLVGTHLFKFGDKDGVGDEALLQHALGVAWLKDRLYVADTYNNKIKTIDPKTRQSSSFLDGFHEPGGIWANNGLLYVADTNAHQIVIVDPSSKKTRTVNLRPTP
jgi:DNA-binding beta-propeller fold protein YncE